MKKLLDIIRSIWVYLNLLVVTPLLSTPVIIFSLLRIKTRYYGWAAHGWAKWMLLVSGVKVRVEGMENAPAGQPRIFVSNHQSWYDVFALAARIPGQYRFVAKKELARIPIFGQAWKAAGHICVDRGDRESAVRSLEEAGKLIRSDGSAVVIFAEGTRSRDGRLQPFKKGAFMLALHTGVDITPVGITGSRQVQAKGSWIIRPGRITVRVGNPIAIKDYGFETRDLLIERARAEIERLMAPEKVPSPAMS
jgi:1-acyl-sn-glycerol-3-phosphate acyltransferase